MQCFISTRTYTLTAKHFDEAYYNALHNACTRDAGVGILFCLRSPFTTSLVATMPGQSLDAAALAAARSALPAAWAPVSQASDECPATAAPRATSGSGMEGVDTAALAAVSAPMPVTAPAASSATAARAAVACPCLAPEARASVSSAVAAAIASLWPHVTQPHLLEPQLADPHVTSLGNILPTSGHHQSWPVLRAPAHVCGSTVLLTCPAVHGCASAWSFKSQRFYALGAPWHCCRRPKPPTLNHG